MTMKWSKNMIRAVYDTPLLNLIQRASVVHRQNFDPRVVQKASLLSIKTGGCTEDCSYCPQSSKYDTFVKAERLMKKEDVLASARRAKEAGSSRFCMGSAWREVGGKKSGFNQILEMVKEIDAMGMEVCTTLGMLDSKQAQQLKEAGLTAYNHNLDTSPEFYPKIISTRTYDERLETLKNVREAGLNVCCGGIIGLGEDVSDRIGLLHVLASMDTPPESVPINALVAVEGTPLQDELPVDAWDMCRMIATTRIVMPKSKVRLSAGRTRFSAAEQAMMFMAGANSIFSGEKLLTTPNPEEDEDTKMFEALGLIAQKPKQDIRVDSAADDESKIKAAADRAAQAAAVGEQPGEESATEKESRLLKN
eukprot:CAMPEP_0170194432 /NCGR_PEP_ID=MMETSP0040_2-20121228/59234_1 /TAXON_ID=641309 /ORGANISM="Lotharella oceanica, Strain CCMP622" /LENGTH=363 /DNA_ID=CAMNT_0010443339 /DNA_START=41 /DNA_END=1132 /DNA_ORIENTATION=+